MLGCGTLFVVSVCYEFGSVVEGSGWVEGYAGWSLSVERVQSINVCRSDAVA